MPQLLSNASATGAAVQWSGGLGVFTALGTFGGATVTLQYLGPDGVTWVAMGTDTTLTAAGGRRAARLDAGGVSDGRA